MAHSTNSGGTDPKIDAISSLSRVELIERILKLESSLEQECRAHAKTQEEATQSRAQATQQLDDLTRELNTAKEFIQELQVQLGGGSGVSINVKPPTRDNSAESISSTVSPVEPDSLPLTPRSSASSLEMHEKRMSRSLRWSEQVRVTRKIAIKIAEAKDLPKGNVHLPSFMADKWESVCQYVVLNFDDKEIARTKPTAKQSMWNEEFEREIESPPEVLTATVWSKGKIKAVFKDTAIGQLNIKFEQLSRDQQRHEEWLPLFRPKKSKDTSLLGSLAAQISITTTNLKNPAGFVTVTVKIFEASNLAEKDDVIACYPYIALHILPDDEIKSTQQTQVRSDTVDPVFNETFVFQLPKQDLPDAKLHLSAWNSHLGRKEGFEHEFLGQITLPLVEFEVLADTAQIPESPHWYALSDRVDRASSTGTLTKAAKIITRGSSVKFDAEKHSGKLSRNQSNLAMLVRSNSTLDIPTAGMRHELILTTFSTPTDCEQCGGIIARPGYKCKPCGLSVHDACRQLLTAPCATAGSIRLSYRFSEEIMLPYGTYSPLMELLTEENLLVLSSLGAACEVDRLTEVAKCSLNIFQSQGTAVRYLTQLISIEVNSTKDPNTIFRSNTLATKAIDYYMKLVGRDYLVQTLKRTINEIFTEKRNCELDPSRIPEKDKRNSVDFTQNRKNLTAYVRRILDAIFNSLELCPPALRQIFEHMQKEVEAKFPNEPDIRYIVVSGFIFLRFFCPAILGPKLFGLRSDFPEFVVGRTLTLAAKVLQNLANMIDFGQKEPFMLEMNEFITEKKESMMLFIDVLSNHRGATNLRIAALEEKIKLEIKIFEGAENMKQATKGSGFFSVGDSNRNSRSIVKREMSESQTKIMELNKELDSLKKARDMWDSGLTDATDYSKKFNFDVEVELARLHGHLVAKQQEVIAALEAGGEDGQRTARSLQLIFEELLAMRVRLQSSNSDLASNRLSVSSGSIPNLANLT